MSITLRVGLQNATKAITFDKGIKIDEMIKSLIQQTNVGNTNDYGIFQSANQDKARWLSNDKTLTFYGLKDGVISTKLFFYSKYMN